MQAGLGRPTPFLPSLYQAFMDSSGNVEGSIHSHISPCSAQAQMWWNRAYDLLLSSFFFQIWSYIQFESYPCTEKVMLDYLKRVYDIRY